MDVKTVMTAEEFETICEQLGPCELVRGEVVRLSPAGLQHSRIAFRIALLIEQWAGARKIGRVFTGEAGIVVESDPDTVRGADVAYFSYQRLVRRAEPKGFCVTPPELVVEVVGKGQGWGEMVEKAGEYLHMGVDRVWVVDPQTRRVHLFRANAEPMALSEGETLSDEAILPGFSYPVCAFFTD